MHRSPEVPRPPSATHPWRATTPGDASSGSCCVPAVPAGRDALLPPRAPRCLHRARSRGSSLQGLLDRRSFRLSASPPLLRLASGRFRDRGPATGVSSLRTIGRSRGDLSLARPPCPPGVSPPWGPPLCRPRIVACPVAAVPHAGVRTPPVRRSSSPAVRDSPVTGSVPSAPEYQRTVESAGLFRGCRPLRGFRPRPPCVLLFT